MERDRVATLILQAHLSGKIDFGRADLADPAWWLKLRLTLLGVERQTNVKWLSWYLQSVQAKLSIPGLKEESFDTLIKENKQLLQTLFDLLFPWHDEKTELSEMATQLRSEWAEIWGDPDDPEVQKKTQRTIDMLNEVGQSVDRDRQRWQEAQQKIEQRRKDAATTLQRRRQARTWQRSRRH